MKARPILFSVPMVRAILEGRKTQTRRIIKPQAFTQHGITYEPGDRWRCPYGKPGDLIWVREAWGLESMGDCYCEVNYHADDKTVEIEPQPFVGVYKKCGNKPSIHMPRWASRITLEITGIRVERLQEISEEDARSEGCGGGCGPGYDFALHEYMLLWNRIHGPGSWDANPWVWVIEFRPHLMNVDEFSKQREGGQP